jgi:hypothetical protein
VENLMPTGRINIQLTFPHGSSPGLNTFHFRFDDDPLGNVQAVVDALEDFYTPMRPFFGQSTTISCSPEAISDPYGDPSYVAVTPWSMNGSGSGNYLPPATQLVVGWRTTNATRSGRGRTFLGPLTEGALDSNGSVLPAALTASRGAATTLVNASAGANGWAIGVYSRTDGLLRDIVSSSVRDQFAVLRSRRD